MPAVAPALHPPAAVTTEVRAAAELRTGDLRALRGIELHAGVELHNDELHSSKQQGDIALALKVHVASICFKCFICLRGMLQGFRMDVAKVDRDVAYIAMVFLCVCPKCFICFRRMLQVFHLDVAYTCML